MNSSRGAASQPSTAQAAAGAADLETVFAVTSDAWERARRAHPSATEEFRVTLAGRGARFRIVGRELSQRFALPFAHLRDAEGDEDGLLIDLWDEQETGVACPFAEVPGSDSPHPLSPRHHERRFFAHKIRHTTAILDCQANRLVGCVTDARHLSLYEHGRPLQAPLTMWHNAQDMPVIHAGLVSRRGRGILLAGSAGAGKSTTAVSCLLSGFTFLSEDLIALERLPDGAFVGHSLYASTYIEPPHLARFPRLAPHAMPPRYPYEDKCLVLLAEALPGRLGRVTRIDAILLPRVAGERHTRIRPASAAKGLLALAPSSLLTRTGTGARGFARLADLVERIPCYWLDLGLELDEIAMRMDEVLDRAAS